MDTSHVTKECIPQGEGSGSRRSRKGRWETSSSCTHEPPPPPPKRTRVGLQKVPDAQIRATNKPSVMHLGAKQSFRTICLAHSLVSHWPRAMCPHSSSRRHLAISLAPEAPGNLDMLADAAVYPPHPRPTEPEQAPSVRLG